MKMYVAAALVMIAIALAGCSVVNNLLYPYTEHGKCIDRCEKEYPEKSQAHMQEMCKARCHREFARESSDQAQSAAPGRYKPPPQPLDLQKDRDRIFPKQ
ncbi:MAG: hypothetical protein AB1473_19110 [Thermodesulfobacteriota bacterium]